MDEEQRAVYYAIGGIIVGMPIGLCLFIVFRSLWKGLACILAATAIGLLFLARNGG